MESPSMEAITISYIYMYLKLQRKKYILYSGNSSFFSRRKKVKPSTTEIYKIEKIKNINGRMIVKGGIIRW